MPRASLWILAVIAPWTGALPRAEEMPREFVVPGPEARREAIGDLTGLPESLRRALEPGGDFEPIPPPGPSDWLAVHREDGQTFGAFRASPRNIPSGSRKTIYLLPLGDLSAGAGPSVETLREFARAFFCMEVKALDPQPIAGTGFSSRINSFTRKRQILTTDILDFLRKKLPADAFCLLAVTMEDLYPDPSWNFVFGQASLRGRTGVYSFARYSPLFYGEPDEAVKGGAAAEPTGGKEPAGARAEPAKPRGAIQGEGGADSPRARAEDPAAVRARLVLRRSCKVLAHETAHMFGMLHCVHFRCLMNGSNHLQEADDRPLHLCPVCLRKLQHSVGFDAIERYEGLRRFHEKAGFDDEARWIRDRVRKVRGESGPGG